MFLAYNFLLALASFIVIPYYLIRGRIQGKYFGTIRQRLGILDPSLRQTRAGAIWLHAVSVGEVLSCIALAQQLRARLPAARLFVSTGTTTGQKMARERLAGLADGFFYVPLDLPFAVRRVLRHVRPRLVIIVETEIWPNLYREVKRHGASLLVVNARISDRSAAGYRRLRFFFRRVLRLADAILAQSAADRQRLIAAGAAPERVEVSGNLKFDYQPQERQAPAELLSLLKGLAPPAVWLAGSTREGEEAQVLAAFDGIAAKQKNLLLILAPRHAERFEEVAQLLSGRGCRFLRRSRLADTNVEPLQLPAVLLLDSLGELATLYPLADVVFVGGSLVDWGGHNVLEPAFAARPVIVGPHMQNFRAIAEDLLAADGLVQVQDAGALAAKVERLLLNRAEAAAIGQRALRFAESNRGAARRAVDQAEEWYAQAVPETPPGALRKLLLWGPARLWAAAAGRRAQACTAGKRSQHRLAAATISIGNLTVGGTGKTPAVLWLIEQLRQRGLNCALLTRGYGRTSGEAVTIIDPAAGRALPAVSATGDEAQIILRRFAIPAGISADRFRAGAGIEHRHRPDVFILDDGFQHVQLARDLDIVLIDVTAPFGGGEMMPLGRLREPLSGLARAGAILLTRCEAGERWDGLRRRLRAYNPHAPVFLAAISPAALVDAATGEERPLAGFSGARVAGFAGVANPASFWRMLEQAAIDSGPRIEYRDHHRYTATDIRRLKDAAQRAGAEIMVTTEKDLVNLFAAANGAGREAQVAAAFAPVRLYWLKTKMTVERGDELLGAVEVLVQRQAQVHTG